jgi:hypothetical protein
MIDDGDNNVGDGGSKYNERKKERKKETAITTLRVDRFL